MSFPVARRRLLLTGAALGAAPGALAQGRDGDVLEISKHETATIDGRQWDTPIRAARRSMPSIALCCCAFRMLPRTSPTCCAGAACWCEPSCRWATAVTRSCRTAISAGKRDARPGPTICRPGTCTPRRCARPGLPTRPAGQPSTPASMAGARTTLWRRRSRA